jgi:acetyl esterase/lipase
VRTVGELAAAHPGFGFREEHAGEVPLLVVTPEGRVPAGVLCYVHGGGMIVGSHLGQDVPNLLSWAGDLGLAVVSPGYRLPATGWRRRSAVTLDGRGLWDRTANAVGWSALLGDRRGGADVPPYAAPARAADLSGLPPAFLDVGTAETFRDEVVAYASGPVAGGWRGGAARVAGLVPRLRRAGPRTHVSRAARAARLTWVRRLLSR